MCLEIRPFTPRFRNNIAHRCSLPLIPMQHWTINEYLSKQTDINFLFFNEAANCRKWVVVILILILGSFVWFLRFCIKTNFWWRLWVLLYFKLWVTRWKNFIKFIYLTWILTKILVFFSLFSYLCWVTQLQIQHRDNTAPLFCCLYIKNLANVYVKWLCFGINLLVQLILQK